MAATVNPAVSGVSQLRWLGLVGSFTGGVSIGAVLMTALVGGLLSISASLSSPRAVALLGSGIVGLGILRDLGFPAPVPYLSTQVPEWLRQIFSAAATQFVWGIHLGLGFLTRYTFSVHLAFATGLWILSPTTALLGAGLFALGKSVIVLAGRSSEGMPGYLEMFERRFPLEPPGLRYLQLTTATISAGVILILLTSSF